MEKLPKPFFRDETKALFMMLYKFIFDKFWSPLLSGIRQISYSKELEAMTAIFN